MIANQIISLLCFCIFSINLSPSSYWQRAPNHSWFGTARCESVFAQINSPCFTCLGLSFHTAQLSRSQKPRTTEASEATLTRRPEGTSFRNIP